MYNYDEIVPNLYVGNQKTLTEAKFNLVINCSLNIPEISEYSCRSIKLAIRDDPVDSDKLYSLLRHYKVLEEIHEYLNEANKSVLVYCNMGIQSSPAIAGCYLIKYYNMTPEESINFIRTKRPIAFFGKINFINLLNKVYSDRVNALSVFDSLPNSCETP